jgi:hypothetical protein
MRVDTTVVETNIHYPTDSGLLGDGARVLTRTMQKVEKAAGGLKKRIRDRMRSVNKKVIAIALAGRLKGSEGEERRVERDRELVSLTLYPMDCVHDLVPSFSPVHLPNRCRTRLIRLRDNVVSDRTRELRALRRDRNDRR